MLCLTQKVHGTDFCVNGIISYNQCFCRASEEINSNPTEQLAFGFGNKHIAGAYKHIDLG